MWSALFSGGLQAWRERRRALRELSDLQRLEDSVLALDEGNLVNRAKVALEAGDLASAERFWQGALGRYPTFARGSPDALVILLGLRRFDEAEALMLERLKQAPPRDPFYAEGYAQIAEFRGDTEAAIQRWAQVRRKYPVSSKAYIQGAICLVHAGRLESAEALVEAALKRFPDDVSAWMEWARTAQYRHDWSEALRRWEVVARRFRHSLIDISMPRVLAELERFEEAETWLRDVQSRSPVWPEIAIERARLAKRRGDEEETVLRWADVRRRFPLLPIGYQEGFRQLREMGHAADAETVLVAAIERFPAEAWPAVEYAALASDRQDWTAAEARWAGVRRGWPDRQDGYHRGAEALVALGREEEASLLRSEYQRRSAH